MGTGRGKRSKSTERVPALSTNAPPKGAVLCVWMPILSIALVHCHITNSKTNAKYQQDSFSTDDIIKVITVLVLTNSLVHLELIPTVFDDNQSHAAVGERHTY